MAALRGSALKMAAAEPGTNVFAGQAPPPAPWFTVNPISCATVKLPESKMFFSFQFFPVIFSSNHSATDPSKHDLRTPIALDLPVGLPATSFGLIPIVLR